MARGCNSLLTWLRKPGSHGSHDGQGEYRGGWEIRKLTAAILAMGMATVNGLSVQI